jgi:hypothetical protein
MAVLSGGDADGGDFAADAGVAEDVVGACRFFHPPGVQFGESVGAGDGFEDAPLLVGVNHEAVVWADLLTNDAAAAEVVLGFAADFELEVGPAFGEGFTAQEADFIVAEAEPANGGGVGGVALGFEGLEAFRHGWLAIAQDCQGLFAAEGVVDVAEVNGGDDLFGRHLGQEEPKGLVFDLGVEIPDGVDKGCAGEVDDAFLGAEPAELAFVGQEAREGYEVGGDVREEASDDEAAQVFESLDA